MSSMDAACARLAVRLTMHKRRRRLVAGILFLIYFAVLFYFLFFSEEMGRTYNERAYHYNLVPFKEISRFIKYRKVLGMQAVFLNIAGNVMAFVPFGAFLPIFSGRCRRFFYTAFYSFELSILVELLQLVFKVGSFDVDDLILNTLGGMLGFLVYTLVIHLGKRKKGAEREGDGS
ncbi:MAG: VanZ family protein [Roseburia sp.]